MTIIVDRTNTDYNHSMVRTNKSIKIRAKVLILFHIEKLLSTDSLIKHENVRVVAARVVATLNAK